MDDISRYNQERWDDLVRAGVEYSRPYLDLTPESARDVIDPHNLLGEIRGKDVLCLASGGGQQSAAFALLGAHTTVLDFSSAQLEGDARASAHYNLSIRTVQGDMRDLSCFPDRSFDIVWHGWSINFVPDPRPAFREAARVLRPGGRYRLSCHNPFVAGLDEKDWDGKGYPLYRPYIDGTEIIYDDTCWTFQDQQELTRRVEGPREFLHSLSGIVNSLSGLGFVLLGIWEVPPGDLNASPATWEHFKAVAPPWLTFWAVYRPDVLGYRAG